ncbi:Na+/H+ antiporter subunit G [Panacagrimonas sp.]|uniref:Na+/H+ antiporter subunit G n=1 Tax=Panacagrimonas sp. TaxID=2480088 RepID=UPI003B517161
MTELSLPLELLISALLVIGGLFVLIGAVGMVRFGDFYMRLHAPTKATTLGVGGVLLASMGLSWAGGHFGVHELLIALFLFLTAPVSANLMAKAALHLRVPTRAKLPDDIPLD